jgi:hypothetical protein
MKTRINRRHRRNRASTLVTVLILGTIALVAAGSLLAWTTTTSNLGSRNNEYYAAVAAAEAATEKVISRIAYDYRQGGEALNQSSLPTYRSLVPNESTMMKKFWFNDGANNAKTYVEWLPPSQFKELSSQYKGLMGYATTFRVASNARDMSARWKITAGVIQQVDVATIPLFQFAIFYNLDLEINPGQPMTVTGPVHGNYDIYMKPGAALTFQGDVTAAGTIYKNKARPGDCEDRADGNPITGPRFDDSANQLNVPVGTNNSAADVRAVVEPPPAGEAPTSAAGKERFYNKADMIITIKGTSLAPTVTVTSGRVNNFATTVPQAQWLQGAKGGFIDYDNTFFNKREGKTVRVVDIDVSRLKAWSQTNTVLRPVIASGGADVATIFVNDTRTFLPTEEPGVRLKNGEELPPSGLTVATPDPVYVWGDYNIQIGSKKANNHDTTYTQPAAILGDAITILSKDWSDADSALTLGARKAKGSGTMVNAAFLAGINQSTNCNYSGGVENFPRFLEDWSNVKFTYNGSMVVMYESKWAKGLWLGTGSTFDIYNPPIRDWAFDANFRNPAKLPPQTPCARALIRGSYAMTKPNTTTAFTP